MLRNGNLKYQRKKAALEAELELLRNRQAEEEKEEGTLNQVSSCRFSEVDVEKLCARMDQMKNNRCLQGALLKPAPKAMSHETLNGMDEHHKNNIRPEPDPKLAWVEKLAVNREECEHIAISNSSCPDEKAYLFLYATQSPQCTIMFF